MKQYTNILLIKPGAVGDLLQLTPAIRALKLKYPEAAITLMLGSEAAASMFFHNPNVHETVVFDRKGEHASLSGFLRLRRRISRAGYDLVINFQRSNFRAWLLASAALPCRFLVYRKARGRAVHAVVNHLETLAPLGIDPAVADTSLELFLGPEETAFADELFREAGLSGRTVIALNPGASNRIKCWSTGQFSDLANRLVDELGAGIVLVGGGNERDLAEGIRAGMTGEPLDLVGRTSLPQLGAVLARCALLVSGDTGPLHMATAVGTPVAGLFGAIDPLRTGPVGEGHRVIRHAEVPCVPCMSKSCANRSYLECMEKITPAEVFDTVREMLAEREGRP
jgi:lipopolysaccharide heptosyltransferase II